MLKRRRSIELDSKVNLSLLIYWYQYVSRVIAGSKEVPDEAFGFVCIIGPVDKIGRLRTAQFLLFQNGARIRRTRSFPGDKFNVINVLLSFAAFCLTHRSKEN